MGAEADWLDAVLEPRPEDSADVRWALETAVALWARGDKPQALRWLQHASQAATADGRQDRASMLDRAASELDTRPLPPKSTSRPSFPEHTLDETEPMERSRSTTSARRRNLPTTAPYQVALDDVTRLVAPDPSLLEACEPEEPLTNREPPKSQKATVAMPAMDFLPQPAPSLPGDALDATLTRVRPPTQVRDPAEHTVVMEAIPEALIHTGSTEPNTLGSPTRALEPMRALRVVVSGGSGKELIVQLLDDGEVAPPGAQEALLIALSPTRSR
jgi:hypothetical protein